MRPLQSWRNIFRKSTTQLGSQHYMACFVIQVRGFALERGYCELYVFEGRIQLGEIHPKEVDCTRIAVHSQFKNLEGSLGAVYYNFPHAGQKGGEGKQHADRFERAET